MLGYYSHVHGLYADARGEAVALWVDFAKVLSDDDPASRATELAVKAQKLRNRVDALAGALPTELPDATGLRRHLAWLDRRLGEGKPDECLQDVKDIATRDLPARWRSFEEWYEARSLSDGEFLAKVQGLLNTGEIDSALRKGWAAFKTRMVADFDVPVDIDGDRLAAAVFGPSGTAREVLPSPECEAYFNLFKGLYALHRNVVVHNDIDVDPAEAEAVLNIMNGALARLSRSLMARETERRH